MMRASEISPKMFDNEFMDFFSRTHWLAVPTIFLPVVAWATAQGFYAGAGVLTVAGSFAAGFVVWTLTEYWLCLLYTSPSPRDRG